MTCYSKIQNGPQEVVGRCTTPRLPIWELFEGSVIEETPMPVKQIPLVPWGVSFSSTMVTAVANCAVIKPKAQKPVNTMSNNVPLNDSHYYINEKGQPKYYSWVKKDLNTNKTYVNLDLKEAYQATAEALTKSNAPTMAQSPSNFNPKAPKFVPQGLASIAFQKPRIKTSSSESPRIGDGSYLVLHRRGSISEELENPRPDTPAPISPVSPVAGKVSTKCDRRKFKTQMCRNYDTEKGCAYGDNCQFAHDVEELKRRPVPINFKTVPCKFSRSTRDCPMKEKCNYKHEDDDWYALELSYIRPVHWM